MRPFTRGDRVKIIAWAISNDGPYAQADRRQILGRTGVVLDAGLYVSVLLDEDPALAKAAVICEESELEVIPDANIDEETNVA